MECYLQYLKRHRASIRHREKSLVKFIYILTVISLNTHSETYLRAVQWAACEIFLTAVSFSSSSPFDP